MEKDLETITKSTLDVERTRMALDRTFLSFIRTALTMLVAGATLLQFFQNQTFRIIGLLLIPCAIIVFIVGTVRVYNKRNKLKKLNKELLNDID